MSNYLFWEQNKSMIVGLVISLGLLLFMIYVLFNITEVTETGFEENLTIDMVSCEKIERINELNEITNSERIKAVMDKFWTEADCNNPSSSYWRGEDWEYQEP